MKTLFDSGVLIAALIESHLRHEKARASVVECRARSGEFAMSQHALVETYAVLTGMQSRPRFTPAMVRLAMRDLLAPAEIVALSPQDYEWCLAKAETEGVTGGAVYDLLNLQAALVWGAERLVTLNLRHFNRLAAGSAVVIAEP